MSFLSLWKRIFGVDSKSPREQFKESYNKGVIRRINPQSYQEGSHDQEGVIDPGKQFWQKKRGKLCLQNMNQLIISLKSYQTQK